MSLIDFWNLLSFKDVILAGPAIPFLFLATAAMQGVAAMKQASAAKDAAEDNARMLEQNARLAKQKAVEDERQYRIQSMKEMGRQQATYASLGLSLEGSPVDILAESSAAAENDVMKIKYGGETASQQYLAQAASEKKKGSAAMSAGYLSAAGSLLGGVAQAASYSSGGSAKKTGSYPGQDY